MKRRIIVIVTVVILVIILCKVFGPFFTFSYFSICSQCGMMQTTEARQLPMIGITYLEFRTQYPTPLSKLLAENDIVANHDHTWIFGHGRGNGIICAIGDGRQMATNTFEIGILCLFDALIKYREKNVVKQWAALVLHPRAADYLRNVFYNEDEPKKKEFENKEEFEKWWKQKLLYMQWFKLCDNEILRKEFPWLENEVMNVK